MIKVGNKTVISNQIILMRDNEDAWITAHHNTGEVKVRIIFKDDIGEAGNALPTAKQTVSVEGKSDHALITLKNWRASAISNPMKLGVMESGEELWAMIDCFKIGKMSKLVIQIMVGGEK